MGETCRARLKSNGRSPFSILERIDVGETTPFNAANSGGGRLSVSSNGSTWVKLVLLLTRVLRLERLSVSSNGSTWVKRIGCFC